MIIRDGNIISALKSMKECTTERYFISDGMTFSKRAVSSAALDSGMIIEFHEVTEYVTEVKLKESV
jgi:hypothetical protein